MITSARNWFFFTGIFLFSISLYAQFRLDGQLVQRAEYRHGYNSLFNEGDEAAKFIGQRARLHARYQTEDFHFFVSVQDIRVWGNTPQIKLTDGFLSVHEAWAETSLWKISV
ncbi:MULTISPECIES: hypothetical protein [Antarcticibacterium]|uniref:hypothetical protein n=1 Tax=Antarcticibacterium TaxID=2058174 RepID=UPI001C5511C7|nr:MULTISPECIES: hypothetical protein [Antarcticibacterium]